MYNELTTNDNILSLISDEDLVSKIRSGNPDAEEILIKRHLKLVKSIVRSYTLYQGNNYSFSGGNESEDIIQEASLGLLSAIRNYDLSLNVPFKAFAILCIRNKIVSVLKSSTSAKHIPLNYSCSLDDPTEDEDISIQKTMVDSSEQLNPEYQFLNQESYKQFIESISNSLSLYELNVLELFLKGYSYSEMAEILNKSIKSIGNAIQRVRNKLSSNKFFGDSSK